MTSKGHSSESKLFMAHPDVFYAASWSDARLHLGLRACAAAVGSGLSLRRLADTNKDNPVRQVRLSFLG